ncbi:MAG: serine protease [Geminicoccaceae bacterium]|nr:serine protease [Geminicoccaceae bacterium]
MSALIPPAIRPDPARLSFDLDRRLESVVSIRAQIPEDAFTAPMLGTQRQGSGVVIGERGLVLTIGYLVNEADQVWLTTTSGRVVQGHPLAYDFVTGFALVQAMGDLDCPVMPRGSADDAGVGSEIVIAAGGGIGSALRSRLIGKREFAGYWEYLLDEALFAMPAHPHWGGTAVIGPDGRLIGIGSLLVQVGRDEKHTDDSNMVVPVDLLEPILDDLVRHGAADRPPRPWLGVYAAETHGGVVVANLADGGPGEAAGLEQGDLLVEVNEVPIGDLADFYRQVWSLGEAGVEVPLTLLRENKSIGTVIQSADRAAFMRRPRLH